MKKYFLLFLLFLTLLFTSFSPVYSQTAEELTDKISELQSKLSELAKTKNTLQNQITYFNSQITLTEYQIKETQLGIESLKKEILDLTNKISVLDLDLNQISATFLTRVAESYKFQKKTPTLWFLASDSFNDSLEKYKYYHTLQLNDRKNLLSLEEARLNYDLQKQKKVEKQAELEALEKRLDRQGKDLANQKAAKNQLLATTKNDELTYQKKLAQARAELASLKRFTDSQGGDICLSSQPSQPDGWFWSQRDPRWCHQIIGLSSDNTDTLGAVGCLVSSVAMVWKKFGQDRNPSQIASDISYFYSNTAFMNIPPPVPNYVQKGGYDPSFIDQNLSQGQPVIIHLAIGGYGHFVVLKSGSNGNYTMNDPWYGPDLPLNSHYSVSSIDSMRTFHP